MGSATKWVSAGALRPTSQAVIFLTCSARWIASSIKRSTTWCRCSEAGYSLLRVPRPCSAWAGFFFEDNFEAAGRSTIHTSLPFVGRTRCEGKSACGFSHFANWLEPTAPFQSLSSLRCGRPCDCAAGCTDQGGLFVGNHLHGHTFEQRLHASLADECLHE